MNPYVIQTFVQAFQNDINIVLLTSFLCYDSEGRITKFPIRKMKLNKTDRNFSAKITQFHNCLHIYFNPSQNVSPILLFYGMMMISNEGSIACKYFE